MNQTNSRTANVVRNTYWAIASQVTSVLLGLISRKIFIDYLGAELLGVNSLFSDVFMLFSFADLGFGTAIVFSMYGPIAESDEKKVSSLLLFYRDIYNYVIIALIIISLGFIPFLRNVNTNISFDNLLFYYLIFQVGNIFSYVWAYRESYVIACQQERKLTVINIIYLIVRYIVQIVVLVLFGSFVFYLTVGVVSEVIKKLFVNHYIKEHYPITILKGATNLSRIEKKSILSKSYALLVTRVSNLLINQTDSLIVSIFINVTQWGLASNYLLIKKSIFAVSDKIYSAVLPSMGNLVATSGSQKKLLVFMKYDFINAWLHTFFFVGLTLLSSVFISLFWGDNLLLPGVFVFIFFFAAFVDGLRLPVSLMREATGTFEVDKWYSVLAAVVNIVTSIPLAILFGLPGVFIGTLCAMSVLHVFRTYILFRRGEYGISPTQYLYVILKHLLMGLFILVVTYLPNMIVEEYTDNRLIVILGYCISVVFIPNFIWTLVYHNNPNFVEIKNKIENRLWKKS